MATNYDPNANIDDGTCNYITTCPESAPTGLYTSGVIQNRATIHWDNMNDSTTGCVVDQYRIRYRAASSSSLISNCSDFVSGPSAWPYVLVATTIADGAASQASQTYTMNVTSLPAGGANFRVVKTTANGNWFNGNAVPLTLGSNSITVNGVGFDRAVKFQFSSGDVEFDALSLNGTSSACAVGSSWF